MIERFNFYDVYGYFIPGALLIAVIWFPHALIAGPPPADLAAAALGIIAAYVAGHVLQIVAAKVLTSWEVVDGEFRAPSELQLSEAHSRLSKDLREKVAAKIKERFGLGVEDSKNRLNAFYLCRNSVISSKTASYVEQFEGMYVLMRGISAAAAVGTAYIAGRLSAAILPGEVTPAIMFLLVLTTIGIGSYATMKLEARDYEDRRAYGSLIFLAVIFAGALGGPATPRDTGVLLISAGASALVSIWTFGAYHAFTWTWVTNVYQHFYLAKETADEEAAK